MAVSFLSLNMPMWNFRKSFGLLLKLVTAFFLLSVLLALAFVYANYGSLQVAYVYMNQLPAGIQERVTNPNFKPTFEELDCQRPHHEILPRGEVPKTVHYVLLSNEGSNSSLTFPAFLSIKATLKNLGPDRVKLHYYDFDEENEWWREISHRVELVRHKRNRRLGPNGDGIGEYLLAHQSDIIRLDVVHNEGGIYLDTDIFPFRPFDDFLNNPKDVVLGHEGANRYGLCNAVIIARKKSQFLQTWIDSYETFDDSSWNFHSVRLPKILATEYPDEVCTLSPMAFFWPTWAGFHTEFMHEPITDSEAEDVDKDMARFNGALYENQFAFHAWGGAAWTNYLSKLTPEKLMAVNTRYNMLMRPIFTADV